MMSKRKIDGLFAKFMDKKSGIIGPEGIEQLCAKLQVEPTDVRILVLAWKMKAERQAYFTKDEWHVGLNAMQADTIDKIKLALTKLVQEVKNPSNFSDFYDYSFRFCLTQTSQKFLDIESVCMMLDIVLGLLFRHQVDKLIGFLKSPKNDYKSINLDQWRGFLRFCQEIHFPSVDNYDESGSWPSILDDFFEWMSQK